MTQYENVYANFLYKFSKVVKKYKNELYSEMIFLCIGTSKVSGDSFGPLVGNKLKQRINNRKIIVLGDLENNIDASNIEKSIEVIKTKYKKPLVISVDAALSRKEDIGKINIYPYGVKIRKAIENQNGGIGDLSIKVVVANNCRKPISNYIELKRTPFSRIDYLSEIIANGINEIIENSDV